MFDILLVFFAWNVLPGILTEYGYPGMKYAAFHGGHRSGAPMVMRFVGAFVITH